MSLRTTWTGLSKDEREKVGARRWRTGWSACGNGILARGDWGSVEGAELPTTDSLLRSSDSQLTKTPCGGRSASGPTCSRSQPVLGSTLLSLYRALGVEYTNTQGKKKGAGRHTGNVICDLLANPI